ncbi:MAG: ribosomal protein S18-alanine N-acetyltransferase [Anaeroplasmataceae bacterium]|nr:ribosomal protein S18-alanine N-acetyltransferase [Anaeroplasmataceae bacterium]
MFRFYKNEDIPQIVELEKKHLESTLGEEYYQKDLTNSLAKHYVCEEDGHIIGFVSSVFDGFSLDILNVVIDQAYQSKGYGTKLLTSLFDGLLLLGLNHVSLEVRESNTKAIGLYEKLGFKTVRTRKEYYKNKEDALFMLKVYDEVRDIIHLEAILFSKKEGWKYTSDFKERYALNYYDLFDHKIDSLEAFEKDEFTLCFANWIDEELFKEYDIDIIGLLHVNAYQYQSLSKKKYEVSINHLTGYKEYMTEYNLQYGRQYAEKFAEFSYKGIQDKKITFFSVLDKNKIVGHVQVFEYHNSIFVMDLFVKEEYRHQSIGSNLMDRVIEYAKERKKIEVYLDVDMGDTPVQMYQKMQFAIIETYYEMFKLNE